MSKKKFNFKEMSPAEIDFVVQNYMTKSISLDKQTMMLKAKAADAKDPKKNKDKIEECIENGKEWANKAVDLFEAYIEHLEGKMDNY